MKKKFLFLNCLLLHVFLFVAGIIMPTVCSAAAKDKLITVMNPVVREILAPRVNLTPRLKTLEGKTIYLVDMNYEGISGTPVMGEIQAWFTKNMPGVKTVLRIKKGNYVADDPELWKEIADKKADGVIIGIAG
ncbi:MAG: hypothetical protein PVG39_06490 [Desulfobacteraceae bacterium]